MKLPKFLIVKIHSAVATVLPKASRAIAWTAELPSAA
jgi:hypothetical protein